MQNTHLNNLISCKSLIKHKSGANLAKYLKTNVLKWPPNKIPTLTTPKIVFIIRIFGKYHKYIKGILEESGKIEGFC